MRILHSSRLTIALVIAALTISACGGGQPTTPASVPSSVPVTQATNTAVPATAAPAATPTTAALPQATTASNNAGGTAGPAWWPSDLAMPESTQFDKEFKKGITGPWRFASWTAASMNVDAVRDSLFKEGTAAGYKSYTSPTGMVPGKLYTVVIWKSPATYELTLAATSDGKGTKIQGKATGIAHIKTTGALTLDMDLPVVSWSFDPKDAAKSVTLGASAPNSACANCFFAFGLDADGYTGPATYTKWTDARVNPGAEEKASTVYRGAKSCSFVVKDDRDAIFECKGLHLVADIKKVADVTGSWAILPQE